MKATPKNQNIGAKQRTVLKILAKAPRGHDVNSLLSGGFDLEIMSALLRGGLAAVRVETAIDHGQPVEVARLRITDAGREEVRGSTKVS